MKRAKVAIIILIVLTIVGIALFFLKFGKVDNTELLENKIILEQVGESNTIKFNVVTNTAMYFTVESSINMYIDYIENRNGVAVYSVLDSAYAQENNISEENVLEHINIVSENSNFDVQKMLLARGEGQKLQQYYVYGILRCKNGQDINREDMYLTVNIDLENMTFSIIPNVPNEEVFDE